MKIKHKLLNDFQFISPDKKIFILKSGSIIEGYNYRVKNELIPIDRDIVDNNPEFFEVVDWRAELMTFMRVNKMPQPAQLGKKLIPFIEEMVLSSISQNSVQFDVDKVKELEEKETQLFKEDQNLQRIKATLDTREKLLSDKELDIDVRVKRLEKREIDFKSDVKMLDDKEVNLNKLSKELNDKNIELEEKLQELNERERSMDLNVLQSSNEIDLKYKEMADKMKEDLEDLSKQERSLDELHKKLTKIDQDLSLRESQIIDRERDLELYKSEFDLYVNEIKKLDDEIKNWESLNFKLRRMNPPPSAII